MDSREKTIIGSNTLISVAGIANIPAKVDTGADSSSIWASNISVSDQGILSFTLLGPEHPLYTGEVITVDQFRVRKVRNSTGDTSIRYLVPLVAEIEGRTIRAKFTLSNRSRNHFPILIGRKTLKGKFLVDVSISVVKRPRPMDTSYLGAKLAEDPKAFHNKYMAGQS